MEAAGPRPPEVPRLVHRVPPGDDGRSPRSGRDLFRYDRGRHLGVGQRGQALQEARSIPSARVLGRGGGARLMTVHIPSPLRSYTAGKSEVMASGRTIAEVMFDL